ncbi:hypothetical protein SAMN02787118_14036 [Streptomyces mirabilis]|uniref:Uncharacterized protein n=1 Tax=Streptomyces mirabilis TaxID=68239 RepID=A0A1I2WVE5_9ACTN|nr:hypothetical protein SAMN02787118_14036 [Streptomyces mirabilis]
MDGGAHLGPFAVAEGASVGEFVVGRRSGRSRPRPRPGRLIERGEGAFGAGQVDALPVGDMHGGSHAANDREEFLAALVEGEGILLRSSSRARRRSNSRSRTARTAAARSPFGSGTSTLQAAIHPSQISLIAAAYCSRSEWSAASLLWLGVAHADQMGCSGFRQVGHVGRRECFDRDTSGTSVRGAAARLRSGSAEPRPGWPLGGDGPAPLSNQYRCRVRPLGGRPE